MLFCITVEAIIGFVSQTLDVAENEKARVAIGFLKGKSSSPVTVRLVS